MRILVSIIVLAVVVLAGVLSLLPRTSGTDKGVLVQAATSVETQTVSPNSQITAKLSGLVINDFLIPELNIGVTGGLAFSYDVFDILDITIGNEVFSLTARKRLLAPSGSYVSIEVNGNRGTYTNDYYDGIYIKHTVENNLCFYIYDRVYTASVQKVETVTIKSYQSSFKVTSIPSSVWGDTGEVIPGTTRYASASDGSRLGYVQNMGLVVTTSGKPVVDAVDSSIITYDPDTQEFTSGANQKLGIFLDSHLDRYYLSSSGRIVNTINSNTEVYMITIKKTDGQHMNIYATRQQIKKPWYKSIFSDSYETRYFDMNGRHIENKYIVTFKAVNSWRLAIAFAFPVYGVVSLVNDGIVVPVVKVLEKTTLGELMTYISQATEHPWEKYPAVTEDGRDIYINPRNNQLADFFGWALFNSKNGLPIIRHSNTLITIDGQAQQLVDGVLKNSMTIKQLLDSGARFSMGVYPSEYGTYDAVIIDVSTDPNKQEWVLPNGDSADGKILDPIWWETLNAESFSEWVNNLFSKDGFMDNLGRTLMIIGIIILVIIFLPLLLPLIKALITLITLPFKWLAKKLGAK